MVDAMAQILAMPMGGFKKAIAETVSTQVEAAVMTKRQEAVKRVDRLQVTAGDHCKRLGH